MSVISNRSGWTLSALLDYFIPKAMIADVEQHRRARMFMLSHVMGPMLGTTLPAYMFVMNIVRDYRVFIFFLSILAFWIYPFLLRWTGRYRLLAFISVQNLSFCVIWACYAFGGLLSPFLSWTLIIPLLAFLYLPSEGWTRNLLLIQGCINVGFMLFLGLGPVPRPDIDLADLQVIGLISMASVAIYFAMMSLYFAKMFNEQREFGRELHSLVSSSDNLRNLTAAARQAGAAKADFIASMSHELRTPLNAIIGYSQLLLEEAEDEGDTESRADLTHVHQSGTHLLYLIDHVLDYSRIEAGRMPINAQPNSFAAVFPRWMASAQANCPGMTLRLVHSPGHDRPVMTDWNAMGAIVENLATSIYDREAPGCLTLTVLEAGANGVHLAFSHHDASGAQVQIQLGSEVFDSSQDVSPTKYGSMGIEPALALKYIQLLDGHILPPGADGHVGPMHIQFPPIKQAEEHNTALRAA